jgi:hypothetical protein
VFTSLLNCRFRAWDQEGNNNGICRFIGNISVWLMPTRFSLSGGKIGWHERFYLLPTSREISLLDATLRNRSKFILNTWLSLRFDKRTLYAAVYISWLHVIITWKSNVNLWFPVGLYQSPFHIIIYVEQHETVSLPTWLITSKQSCRLRRCKTFKLFMSVFVST